jgi:hypothetical protein
MRVSLAMKTHRDFTWSKRGLQRCSPRARDGGRCSWAPFIGWGRLEATRRGRSMVAVEWSCNGGRLWGEEVTRWMRQLREDEGEAA